MMLLLQLITIIFFIYGYGAEGSCTGIKSCDYPEKEGNEIQYDLCDTTTCPPDEPNTVVSSCKVFKYKKKDQYFQCTKCKKAGGSCEKHDDCCQGYIKSKDVARGLPIILFPYCNKGVCTACLKVGAPCGGVTPLPCCDTLASKEIHCEHTSYLRFYPPAWDVCSPRPCDDAALEKTGLWRPRCYTIGHAKTKPQYLGVNMCKCPINDLTGYHCVSGHKCVKCGLETASCSKNADCCYAHSCVSGKCKQGECRIEGQSCSGCKEGTENCEKDDLKCCGKLRCYKDYKFCTSAKCGKNGYDCSEDAHCCDGFDCIANGSGETENGSPGSKHCRPFD